MRRDENIDGLTYEEWLTGGPDPLPENFRKWEGAWGHWNQGSPLGWAIYCFDRAARRPAPRAERDS